MDFDNLQLTAKEKQLIIKCSSLDADGNYLKSMRPSGDLNLSREHGLREQKPLL